MDNEKSGISFKDFLYLLKKYWIAEAAIILVIVIFGTIFATFRKDVYEADIDVMVQAKLSEAEEDNINNVPYTNFFMANVCRFIVTDVVVNSASQKVGSAVNVKNLEAVSETNVWIINVSYKDNSPSAAKNKLLAVIDAAEELAQMKDENGDYIYFQGYVRLPELGEATVKKVNSTVKTIILSGVIGVVLAIAAAFVLYFVNDKVTDVNRVVALTNKNNLQTVSGSARKVKRKSAAGGLYPMNLDKLADTLVFLQDGDNGKVYQVQSSVGGEGKSTVAANLAITLGAHGRKTVIIECDLRKPRVFRNFNFERSNDLTDYMKDIKTFDEAIRKTENPNVDAIICGERNDNPMAIFISEKFAKLIEQAREKYDFVLLDCPPVCEVPDYMAISGKTDSTILVVGRDVASSVDLKNAVAGLTASGADIVGTVFNFAATRHNDAYYNYYSDEERHGKDKNAAV